MFALRFYCLVVVKLTPRIEFDGGIPNARRPSSSRFETQKFNYFRIIQAVV